MPRGKIPACSQYMLTQVFAKTAAVPVVVVLASKLLSVADVAVEGLAAGERPVVEVEGRIALEAFEAAVRIAGVIQAVGLCSDTAEAIDELERILENFVLELAVFVDLVPHCCNRMLHLGLQMVSRLAPRDHSLLEAEMGHSWQEVLVVEY